jgi:hypothetical protein
MEHWAAIHKSEHEYLIPLLKWAHLHPQHGKFGGKNWFTVFSMDLGRQDFNNSAPWLEEWSVGQLAGDEKWIWSRFWTGPMIGPSLNLNLELGRPDEAGELLVSRAQDMGFKSLPEREGSCYIADTESVVRACLNGGYGERGEGLPERRIRRPWKITLESNL